MTVITRHRHFRERGNSILDLGGRATSTAYQPTKKWIPRFARMTEHEVDKALDRARGRALPESSPADAGIHFWTLGTGIAIELTTNTNSDIPEDQTNPPRAATEHNLQACRLKLAAATKGEPKPCSAGTN